MKLEEAFKKYGDEIKMKRTSSRFDCGFSIEFLKMHHAWGNQESRDLGFWISNAMIEDASADDWEIYEDPDLTPPQPAD